MADPRLAEVVADRSLYSLIGANAGVAVIAVILEWDLHDLLVVYCAQNIIFGISFLVRILQLPPSDDSQVARAEKLLHAFGFFMFYGILNFAWFKVLTRDYEMSGMTAAGLALGSIAFALNHAYSLVLNIGRERARPLNFGRIVLVPFLRILPMQLPLIGAGLYGTGPGPVLVAFIGLKTVADVAMHVVEHRILRQAS